MQNTSPRACPDILLIAPQGCDTHTRAQVLSIRGRGGHVWVRHEGWRDVCDVDATCC